MMLQPRNFKYNTSQNVRSASHPGVPNMAYGSAGLILLSPFRISANSIFRLNLFLNRSASNSDITRRAFWVSIFPHLPLSRNPNGMRMGKGAGKLSTWYTQMRSGNVLVEFNNLSLGRAAYYANQVAHNLPVPATFSTVATRNVRLANATNTNPTLIAFW